MSETTPPELETMKLEVDGRIGTLTLDRPGSFNAMSPDLIAELLVAAIMARRPRSTAGADRHGQRPRVLLGRGHQLVQGRPRLG